MKILILTAFFFGLAMLIMAVGVIFKRPCLRGSCGGPRTIGPDGEDMSCETCPNKDKAPEERTEPGHCEQVD